MSNTIAIRANRARHRGRPCRSGLSAAETLALIVLGVVLVSVTVWVSVDRPASVPTVTIRVEAGDSLWQLAHRHPIPGWSTEQTVEFITQTNGLDGAAVREGVALAVPQQPQETATAMR